MTHEEQARKGGDWTSRPPRRKHTKHDLNCQPPSLANKTVQSKNISLGLYQRISTEQTSKEEYSAPKTRK